MKKIAIYILLVTLLTPIANTFAGDYDYDNADKDLDAFSESSNRRSVENDANQKGNGGYGVIKTVPVWNGIQDNLILLDFAEWGVIDFDPPHLSRSILFMSAFEQITMPGYELKTVKSFGVSTAPLAFGLVSKSCGYLHENYPDDHNDTALNSVFSFHAKMANLDIPLKIDRYENLDIARYPDVQPSICKGELGYHTDHLGGIWIRAGFNFVRFIHRIRRIDFDLAEAMFRKWKELNWIMTTTPLDPEDRGNTYVSGEYYPLAVRTNNLVRVSMYGTMLSFSEAFDDATGISSQEIRGLDDLNLLGLISHEVVYALMEENGTAGKDGGLVRQANAKLFQNPALREEGIREAARLIFGTP
jgi:hypothetical protein